MNLSYGETEYDYRFHVFASQICGRNQAELWGHVGLDSRACVFKVLWSRWVNGKLMSKQFTLSFCYTYRNWNFVSGWNMVFARSCDLGNSALTFKALSVSNFKPKGFFFLISLLYWIRFIQLWWSFLKIWRRFCLMTNIQWIPLSWQMTVNKVELNFSWYYPCFSHFLNHPDFASPTFQTTSRTFQSSLNHLFSSFPSDLTSHTKVQSTMEIACFGIYSTVTRARLRH